MCNCNSSFCAVCCRRVKAYRFDNVPEITGDLQLYTEFYKVGEAYGHWKFTIDDLEAYLDIPTVLWSDKLVAFGHTITGGLFYQSDFRFDYTTSSLTIGTRGVGTEGLYSASFGNNIVGDSSLAVGDSNEIGASSIAVGSGNFGGSNNIFLFGDANSSSQRNATIFGDSNKSSQQKINIFGYNLTASHGGNAMFSDAIGGSSSIADNAFTAQFAGGYRFRLDAASTAVNISSTGIVSIDNVVNNNTETQLLVWNVTTKEVEYRTASSLPFGSGTVTAVNSGAGMDFANFTTSGTIILGTPSSITLSSTNAASGTTHSHALNLGGTGAQYLAGDTTLQTFPTIPTQYWQRIGGDTLQPINVTDNLLIGNTTGTRIVTVAGGNSAAQGGVIVFSRGGSNSFFFGNDAAGFGGNNDDALAFVYGNNKFHIATNAVRRLTVDGSGYVTLTSIPTSSTSVDLLTTNAGVIETRTIASLGYLPISTAAATYVPYTGAITNVDLGANDLNLGNNTATRNVTIASGNSSGQGGYILFKRGGSNTFFFGNDTAGFGGNNGDALAFVYGANNFHIATNSARRLTVDGNGYVTIGDLAGVGTRMVVASSTGVLSTQAISGGTLTNFSANDLTTGYTYPLFTVNVTNPTTIPDLTFALPSLPQKFVFAAPWGITGTPLWRQLLPSDLQADGATSGQVITWNGTAWVPQNPSAGVTPSALTRTNDTNVTLTLGGSPTVALLAATSITLGWTGVLSEARGGSKWTSYSTYLAPTLGLNIRTQSSGTQGYAALIQGTPSQAGYLEIWRPTTQARVGYIGYQTGYMSYVAEIGNHQFSGGTVQIATIPISSTSVNLLTTNGGVVETRTIASLTGLTTDVFKIQGGTTNASAITDDIYHNGKLKLGTSTSSAYQLSVSGTGYFTSTVDFNNNVGIQGFTTGAVIKNLVKLNSSNQEEIGVSGTDIILPAYTSARSADTKVSTDKYMYVNASGLVKLDSDENIRNIIGWISKTTNTGVTAGGGPTKISGSTVQQTAGGPYTTVSGNLTIPAQDRYHLITVTVQFVTTSGVAATPNITFDVYNGSGVVQDSAYIVNHDVINDTKEYSFVLQGTTAGVTSIYVRATATVAGITVQKCHMKAMDMGPV
jgi:hypothetical protein